MSKTPMQPENTWHHPLPSSIQNLLQETETTVRRGEIRYALWLMTFVTLVFLSTFVLAEHWIFTRGLSVGVRTVGLLVIFTIWGGGFWWYIFPLLRWKLHPYYLAKLIESARPELKNNLLNLLFLLREYATKDGDETEPNPLNALDSPALEHRVLRVLELQTARQAAMLEVNNLFPINPARIWKIMTICFLGAFLVYAILMPKSSLRTVVRTLLPWCQIDAPSRVRIVTIATKPENMQIREGEKFTVNAHILRLRHKEIPKLFYTTSDRKQVQVPITMRKEGSLPAMWTADMTFDKVDTPKQLSWHIEAGDARSATFPLTIQPPLRASIHSVTLTPPKYTHLPTIRQKTGDILAVSGTRANIFVQTSEPTDVVTLQAHSVTKNTTQKFTLVPMKTQDGSVSKINFRGTIVLKSDEPERLSATLNFRNLEGEECREPLVYQWEILADSMPTIHILDAPAPDTTMPTEGEVTIRFSASDTDFGLRAVAFCATWNGKLLHIPPMLNIPKNDPGMKTPYFGEFSFRPTDWKLQSGDEIFWWIEVADTCEPTANRTKTAMRRLRILDNSTMSENARAKSDSNTLDEVASTPENTDNTTDEHEKTDEITFPASSDISDASLPNDTIGENENVEGDESDAEKDAKTGSEQSATSESQARNGEPDVAPEGYDPLSESESQKNAQGENIGKNANANNGEIGNEGEKKEGESTEESTEESTDQNASQTDSDDNPASGEKQDETQAEKQAENEGNRGQSGEQQEQDGEEQGASGKESSDDTKPQDKPHNGVESGNKTKQNGTGKRPNPNETSLQDEVEDNGNGGEDTHKNEGNTSSGGAKTDDALPDDATSAQSGLQDGSDSNQDLPDAVTEKSETDGSGLQDSDSKRPNRETIPDDGSDGSVADDENDENMRPGDENEMNGTQPNPKSNPGEAFEEILKHRQSTLPPNEKSPENGDESTPLPEVEADATMGKNQAELQEHEASEGAENGSQNQDEKKKNHEPGQSSPQDGNQRGDRGDRKSKTEIKADNSTESAGRSEENKGGNRSGAEEQSNQQGLGRDGSNTPNPSGNPAGSGGEGPTGERGGNNALADQPTGSPDPQKHEGSGSSTQNRGKNGTPESQSHNSNLKTENTKNSTTSGGSGIGENIRSPQGTHNPSQPSAKQDAVNLEFAQKQTVLALEHLRDALDRDDDSLLEYLGWTRDEARKFLQEWEKLNQSLTHETLADEERRRAEDAFRSLGLTPRTLQYQNQTEREKVRPSVRSGRKIEAPNMWKEQFDAYSHGVGSAK